MNRIFFLLLMSSLAQAADCPCPTPSTSPSPVPPSSVLPKGNAAWVYDLNYGTNQTSAPAMWASQIRGFNAGASPEHQITTVYSYAGDMEYYPTDKNPYQTYFPVENQIAAKTYKTVPGVKNVVVVIDGVMTGTEGWEPNFNKLSIGQIQMWADRVANLFCSFEFVDGLQLDLEPVNNATVVNYNVFISRLSADLMLVSNNCINDLHPYGRSLGAFMFASAASTSVFQALGPNGYVVASGYDLSDAPAGTPNSPTDYTTKLKVQLQALINNSKPTNGSYVIGIPAGSSTHEFTQYRPATGPIVQGYPMYSDTQLNYITEAVKTSHSMLSGPQWLGTALWGFSSEMAYPSKSNNIFYPNMPFAQSGSIKYMQENL